MGKIFDDLIGEEAVIFARGLTKVFVDLEAWTTLYRDPRSGEEYLMDYLHPEMHGGGIPRLRLLSSHRLTGE